MPPHPFLTRLVKSAHRTRIGPSQYRADLRWPLAPTASNRVSTYTRETTTRRPEVAVRRKYSISCARERVHLLFCDQLFTWPVTLKRLVALSSTRENATLGTAFTAAWVPSPGWP